MGNDAWEEKYFKPVVEKKIVGFSGIDPQRKLSEEEEETIERTVDEIVEQKVSGMVDEGVEEKMNTVLEIRVGD